jgi:hypothetical protein
MKINLMEMLNLSLQFNENSLAEWFDDPIENGRNLFWEKFLA